MIGCQRRAELSRRPLEGEQRFLTSGALVYPYGISYLNLRDAPVHFASSHHIGPRNFRNDKNIESE